MIWQGCESLVSPLMTGTVAWLASSAIWRVVERADDDTVDEAREDAGGVGDGFAAAELHLRAGETTTSPPSWRIADVEGDARARRGLVEDHRQRLAGERLVARGAAAAPRALDRRRGVENGAQVRRTDL